MRREVAIALCTLASTLVWAWVIRPAQASEAAAAPPPPPPPPTPVPKPSEYIPGLLDPWAAEERAATVREKQYPVPVAAWRVEQAPLITLEPSRMYAAKFDVSFPASMGASVSVVRSRLEEFAPWVALGVWQEPAQMPKDFPIRHASTKEGGVYYALGVPRALVRVQRDDVSYLAELVSRELLPSERG